MQCWYSQSISVTHWNSESQRFFLRRCLCSIVPLCRLISESLKCQFAQQSAPAQLAWSRSFPRKACGYLQLAFSCFLLTLYMSKCIEQLWRKTSLLDISFLRALLKKDLPLNNVTGLHILLSNVFGFSSQTVKSIWIPTCWTQHRLNIFDSFHLRTESKSLRERQLRMLHVFRVAPVSPHWRFRVRWIARRSAIRADLDHHKPTKGCDYSLEKTAQRNLTFFAMNYVIQRDKNV